jgi:outer membrane protein
MKEHSIMRVFVVIAAALAMAAFAPAVARAQAELKIGYVDSEQLIQQSPGYDEAKSSFDAVTKTWRDSLEAKRTQLQALFEEYKRQEAVFSPEMRAEKQQEMLQLEQEAQRYFQTKFGPEGEAATRQAELMQPIIERVNAAIDQVRREGSYSLIFDLNDGALVAGDPALNITDQVVQRLRSGGSSPSR